MITEKNRTTFLTSSAFAVIFLPLLAIAFNWPYLKGGFWADDFFFLNILKDGFPDFSHWRGMWSIAEYPGFDHIWWRDADWVGYFWRPVSSLVIEGSIRLFGENPFPLHLTSILLHAGVTTCVYFLVKSLLRHHGLALLAAVFYVSCEDHSMGVGWISGVSDLLCVQFIMLALLCHIYWLRHRRPFALIGSLLSVIVAMGSKETAAIAPLAMALTTLLLPTGTDTALTNRTEIRKHLLRGLHDWISWVPAMTVFIIYFAAYKFLSLGTSNSLIYINPLSHPVKYLGHMILHLPVMWLGSFSIVPPFLVMFFRDIIPYMALAGGVIFAVWLAALRPFRYSPMVWWAVIIYVIALLPQVSTDASERGLYFPMVPASILLALVAGSVAPLARRLKFVEIRPPRLTRAVGWFAIIGVLLPGIVISFWRPPALLEPMGRIETELLTTVPYIEQKQAENVVILNASGNMITLYAWVVLNHSFDRPLDVWLLSAANAVFSLEKLGDSSFVIRSDRPDWLGNWFARVMRTEEKLSPGRQYQTSDFVATLTELSEDSSDALEVRFDFEYPLDDPVTVFLRWNGKAFEPLDIPALRTGETVRLGDTSDLLKAIS